MKAPTVPTAAPLDHPTPDRPHRVYAALTNGCNRACPWCSTCSSPSGSTWLTPEALLAALPSSGPFELQLEGGEPTVHPRFWDFVALARGEARCTRLVVCTNGVVLPRDAARLEAWLARLGAPLTVKLSVNHHLLAGDAGLLALASLLARLVALRPDTALVLNVRLRPDVPADLGIVDLVRDAGLLPLANVFHLQRYGFASGEAGWEAPFVVSERFTMVNPDGTRFGPDLVARSEAMRRLP